MPNRLITYLGTTFGVVIATYLSMVVFTVYLASEQTRLGSQIGDTEASIGTLEASYYQQVTKIDAIDPAALGFVQPQAREYARAATAPVLTRAGL
ncbi:MAG TPA: hypothetical protein VHB93_01260 [Candidatus Paceibacterota bacterium]|nr:hypothetical protein [Candidatus Paceibacterota bacterium]